MNAAIQRTTSERHSDLAHDIVRTADAIERRLEILETTQVSIMDVVLGRCIDRLTIDWTGLTRITQAADTLRKECAPDDLLYVQCEGMSVSSLCARAQMLAASLAPLREQLSPKRMRA